MERDAARKRAISAILKLALWEGAVLAAVVVSFFLTGSVTVLVVGVVASTALFAPLFLRWFKEHKGAMAGPSKLEENQ